MISGCRLIVGCLFMLLSVTIMAPGLKAQDAADDGGQALEKLFAGDQTGGDQPAAADGKAVPSLPPTAPPESAQPTTGQPATAQPATAQPESTTKLTSQPQPESAQPKTAAPDLAKPLWQTEGQGGAMSGGSGPLPDFDSSQSPWKQLDVGQADNPVGAAKPKSKPAPSEVKTITGVDAQAATSTAGQKTGAPPDGQTGQAAPSEPAERTQMRELFSDFMTDQPAASGAVGGNGDKSAAPGASNKVIVDLTAGQDNPAISKAGSLLTVMEPKPGFGEARVLQPGGEPQAPPETPVEPVKKGPQAKTPTPPVAPPVKTEVKPKKDKTAATVTPKAVKARPVAAPSFDGQLALINESGRPGAAESYSRVLSQMGFKISGVAEGPAQKGQSVITYRPGFKAQAQALAQRVPGGKVLLQADSGPGQASDLVLHIR